MLKLDEMMLVSELRRLPASLRVAFAAACAERQMPAYRLFHAQTGGGDPEALERALEDVWSEPTPDKAESELERQIEQVMELIPQDNGMPSSWTEQASLSR